MASIDDRIKAAIEKAKEPSIDERIAAARDKAVKWETFRANYVEPVTGSERRDRANTVAARDAEKMTSVYAGVMGLYDKFGMNSESRVVRSANTQLELGKLEREREDAEDMFDTYSKLYGSPQTSPAEKKAALEQKNRFGAEVERIDDKIDTLKKNAVKSPFAPDYDALPKAADFEVYSKLPGVRKPADDMEEYIHSINEKMERAMDGTPVAEIERKADMEFLTDTEKQTYEYLRNKHGESMAEGYLNSMADTIARRRGGEIARTLKEEKGPARAVQTGGFALRSGFDQFGSGIIQATKEEVRPTTAVSYGAKQVREDLGEAGPKVLGASLGQWAFDAGQTVGNMLPSMLLSGGLGAAGVPAKAASLVGSAAMGASAGGNAYAAAVNEGMSKDEAREYGRLIGAAAGTLQYALGGIDKLSGGVGQKLAQKAAGIENGFVRFIATHGANALSEASEEALESILEPVFREMATGDDAELDWSEVAYSALLGGLTGAALGGGADTETGASTRPAEEPQIVPPLPRVSKAEDTERVVPPLPNVTKAEDTEQTHSITEQTHSITEQTHSITKQFPPITEQHGTVPPLPSIESVHRQAAEEDRRVEMEKARDIASKLGVELREERLGAGHHGRYENGVITINSDSEDPVMQTFVHELTHHLESSGNYDRLRRAALSYISENMGADVESMKANVIAEYAKGGIELDGYGAERELVAQFASEMVFTDEAAIMRLAQTDRNLFLRIYDWIRDTISKLGENANTRALIDARRMYEKALRTVGDTQGTGRSLYAGEGAKNADLKALSEARDMEARGSDSEEIRQKTGWFRGADNKWRFEIDDSGMEYNRQGFTENPDILRRRELENKLFSGEMSDTEFEALRSLTAATKGVPKASKLGDYIKHEELFENYPELRGATLVFEELPEGVKGRYNPERNTITISPSIRSAPERVLIHEIQHAVQNVEGFSPGTNRGYWQDVLEHDQQIYSKGMNESLNRLARFEAENREAVAMAERIDEALMSDDDGAEYEAALEEAEEKGLMDAVMEYDELRSEFYAQKARPGNRVPSELYRDTAGEIEARDAANRAGYTPQQRRKTAPDTGNEDTVFAEGAGVSLEFEVEEPHTRPYVNDNGEVMLKDADGNWKPRKYFIGAEARKSVETLGKDSPFSEGFEVRLRNDNTRVKAVVVETRSKLLSEKKGISMGKAADSARRAVSAMALETGGVINLQSGLDIQIGRNFYSESVTNAAKQENEYSARLLPAAKQLLREAHLIGVNATEIDKKKSLKGKNNPHRLFQYIFAAPCEMDGPKIAVMRVDVMENQGESLNRAYNLRSMEYKETPSGTVVGESLHAGFRDPTLPNEVYTISIAELVRNIKDEYIGNHVDMPSDAQASYGGSLAEQVKKAGGKPTQKKPTDYRPTMAKRDLRRDLLGLFSVGEGNRVAMGNIIDGYADRLVKNGEISVDDRQWLFDALYESGVMTVQADEYLSIGRGAVAGGRIYVDESTRADFGDDWNNFRRRAFGAGVYLTANHADAGADVWNAELAEMLPGLFDAGETDSRTMLENIVKVAEDGKAQQMSLPDYTAMIAKQEHVSEDELIEHMERQVDWALRAFGEKAGLELWFKKTIDNKVQRERERNWNTRKEQIQRQKENRELRELQQRTLKQLQWLSKNRRKAPADLQAAWDEVLSDIDIYAVNAANEMRWSEKHQATWKDLAQLYKDAKTNDPNFLPSKELEQIVSRLDDRKIGEMDIDALSDLYKAAVGLRTEFYNRNNVIADENHQLFADVYADSKAELTSAPGGYTGKGMDKLFNLQQLTPMNVLQRMVGWNPDSTWYAMGRQLEKGERDMRAFHVEANRQLEDFLTENEDWVKQADGQGKDAIWYEIEVPELLELNMGDKPIFGDTVKVYMTPAQKVHLYLESKSEDNLRHMTGGRTFVDREIYSKGQRSEALARGRTIKLAPETVRKIVSDLTPTELELAKLLEGYYNSFAKDRINKISNILYGFDKAVGKNYAPIYTNKNYTKTEIGTFDTTAEGVGNLKARQYSKNPSYNLSAFDAFERHVDQTARFVGMAIPARNWTTLLNWRESNNSMADVLTHKWGQEGKDYITGLIESLQAGKSLEKDVVSETADKVFSKYVSAVFGANPSVVLKQLGSIPLASAYLDAKNIPTPAQVAGVDRALISKYTSELDHRTMGYSMPETKLLKDNPGWTDTNKFVNFTFGGGAITAMDGWASSTLWPWAENKVRRDFPGLDVGTQEQIDAGKSPFYQKVAELYNDALTRTQSVSDETHQSTIRKSKNPLTRAFTMFKSDAAQGYNVLRQKVGEAQYYKRTGADQKTQSRANRAAGGAVLSIGAGYLYAQGISFLIALWKNKGKKYRDEDEELRFGSVAKEMCSGLVSDFAGMVVGGGELAEVIGNVLTGEKWYGIETPGTEQLTELVDTIAGAMSELGGVVGDATRILTEGGNVGEYFRRRSGDIRGVVKDAATTIATYIGGVSVNNVEAYLLGGLRWIAPGMAEAYDAAFDSSTRSDMSGLEGEALAVRVYGALENRLDEVEESTSDEIAALYEAGFKGSMPGDTPGNFTVDGEDIALDVYQQQLFDKVWCDSVRGTIDEVVSSEAFTTADNAGREKILKRLYDYATAKAKSGICDKYELPSWVVEVDEAIANGASFAEMASQRFAYWDGSARAGYYDSFLGAGLAAESSKDLADRLEALEPESKGKQVSSMQKLRAVAESGLRGKDLERALSVVMTDSQLEGWNSADGLELDVYIDGLEIEQKSKGVKDSSGSTVTGSKALEVMQGIDAMALGTPEKIRLFEALGYDSSESLWHTQYEGDDYESFYYMTDSARDGFLNYCTWMDASEYAEYYEAYSGFSSDKDSSGKTVKAKKEKVIEYIDSLDLTDDQKSALFVSFGYAMSSLKDCIWYNPIAMRSRYFPVG